MSNAQASQSQSFVAGSISNEGTKGKDNLHLTESMPGMEIMMRRLLDDHDARAEERSRRLHLDQKRTIETAIIQYEQSLNTAIAQKRTARIQAIAEVYQQIQRLQEEFKAFAANSKQLPPREGRGKGDEVVI